ncbi:MAG: PAS domain-containing protein [Gammaproteobacteria bacterium]|nr:PAS domain-containing protein [Gammaproteobacteria bacterium]
MHRDTPPVDPALDALGHFAFEWRAAQGWWASPGGRELLGLPRAPAFVDNAAWWACVHPDDRARATAAATTLHQGAERCQCNVRVLAAGAGPRWVLIRAQVDQSDAAAGPQRIRGTITAIDDVEQDFLAAHRPELCLVEAVDHAHIAWYERHGSLVYGSATIAELFDLDDPTGPWEMTTVFERLAPLEFERHCHDLRVARRAPDARQATHVTYYRVSRRDGSTRDIEIRYRIVDAGEPLRTYGLIFDVTATKALEGKFQDAMEHAGVAWFERDIATDVVHGSRSLWRLYGLDPEIQPLRFADLHQRIHPDDQGPRPLRDQISEAARREQGGRPGNGPSGTVRYRVKREDGAWRWIEVRYVTRLDGHGGGSVSGLVVDITAAQEAAEAVRAGRAHLLLALEAARMATWQWDTTDDLVQSSDVLSELYDLEEPGPWPIQHFIDRMHPEDRPRIESQLALLLAHPHDEMLSTELRLVQADGSERWFEVRGRSDGDRIIGVSTDITARKHAEADQEHLRRQLQQAQKMEAIGQLTGGIAHDFNNILASVLGYADLAQKRFGDDMPERLAGYVHEMQIGARRACDLVRQLLAFSRDEGAELSPVAVGAIVDQAIRMLRPTLPASIVIDIDHGGDLPAVMADPVQLQQVVMNLCINARDAMGGAGRIDIVLDRTLVTAARCTSCQQACDGDFVVIALRDSGPGIAAARQLRIFEPFYTTKAPGQGTGMGLSMVHGIVHRLGGHVRLDSAPGRGTTFEILLPVTAAVAADAPHASPNATAGARRGDILVVDDEPGVVAFVAEFLELAGYRVERSSDPQAALDHLLAGERAVDLVISDQTMPGLTGCELATRLRAARPELPVILMSGYSATLDAAGATAAGARAYLAKPLDPDALLEAIATALVA